MSQMMAPMGQKLLVNVIQAEGLHHLNHFTGDHPYCVCEVKHADSTRTKAETKPVTEGDTINPVWNETIELERWTPGEPLEFTIYDKGLLGSKTEGKATLPSEYFYPNGFQGMVCVVGLPDARLRLEIPPPAGSMMQGPISGMAATPVTYQAPTTTYGAPTTTYAAPSSSTYGSQQMYAAGSQQMYAAPTSSAFGSQQMYAAPTSSAFGSQQIMMPAVQTSGPQKLAVSILQAHGLQHMNHFTGDHPYVTCEVKHFDSRAEVARVETKPVTEGDTLNPFWGETLHLGPWQEGEPLEFTVYDKGLIGSKTEGKVTLSSEFFFPNGFSGMVAISGLPHALLHVIIRPLGPMVGYGGAMEAIETNVITDAVTKSKKKKKMKIGKKSKGCC